MLLTEYNEEKVLKKERKEGWKEGKAEGIEEGKAAGRAEGIAEGRAEGIAVGKVLAYADLVSDGLLTVDAAAKKAGMTADEFRAECGMLQ